MRKCELMFSWNEGSAGTKHQIEMLIVAIHRQKNDQRGRGKMCPLPMVTKAGEPVGQVVAKFLRSAPTEGPLFQTTKAYGNQWTGAAITRDAFQKALQKAVAAALPDISSKAYTIHSLRRSGFCAAKRANISHDLAVDIMGHNSTNAWLAYFPPSLPDIADAIASI
uniref:Tyr recombinase domain-containing protein n=1 Tax=Chromera velia CCMP2878 TaxID=1169474 RepID=A0A0G4HZ06_9ALVE|eukprot:Cvel_9624.t1-p1 / transcript=Cvel_9624.t1 / gene=Cvel_9624 / organism=Chromera_velia_CCMP2878 / gene_product=hypothetical protein / transcript_product=hypothetical protein / location=Cvel_scaffold559:66009-66503(-) / protein_length=165 / sequence_SO=supercontig / SO=protein_coding / is_pseudo=false